MPHFRYFHTVNTSFRIERRSFAVIYQMNSTTVVRSQRQYVAYYSVCYVNSNVKKVRWIDSYWSVCISRSSFHSVFHVRDVLWYCLLIVSIFLTSFLHRLFSFLFDSLFIVCCNSVLLAAVHHEFSTLLKCRITLDLNCSTQLKSKVNRGAILKKFEK